MPNWTTPALPGQNIVRRSFWKTHIIDNERALNDIIGHTDAAHVSLTDGAPLLGNDTGALDAGLGVLAKGTLLAGDGAANPTALAVGANDTLLRGEASEAAGVKWELSTNWDVAEALMYG